jgi:S-formylglutathione hydrolase
VQLQPKALEAVCADKGYQATIRMQEGYDHSYFFIATFVGEHVAFHAKALTG